MLRCEPIERRTAAHAALPGVPAPLAFAPRHRQAEEVRLLDKYPNPGRLPPAGHAAVEWVAQPSFHLTYRDRTRVRHPHAPAHGLVILPCLPSRCCTWPR